MIQKIYINGVKCRDLHSLLSSTPQVRGASCVWIRVAFNPYASDNLDTG